MAVYVDEIFTWPIEQTPGAAHAVALRTGGRWCHMTADTVEELHAMADRIGLRRAWFQNKDGRLHYDLTPGKRMQAVRHGAVFKPAKEQARERKEREYDSAGSR